MKTKTNRKGFALVEASLSSAILMIAVMGSIKFDYYAAIDSYKSQCQLEACMIGSMIMESWQGQGGTFQFDPRTDLSGSILDCSDIEVLGSWFGPPMPSGFSISYYIYPYYKISVNGVTFRATLSYKIINGYKYLNVRIGWPSNVNHGYWSASDYIGITECMD